MFIEGTGIVLTEHCHRLNIGIGHVTEYKIDTAVTTSHRQSRNRSLLREILHSAAVATCQKFPITVTSRARCIGRGRLLIRACFDNGFLSGKPRCRVQPFRKIHIFAKLSAAKIHILKMAALQCRTKQNNVLQSKTATKKYLTNFNLSFV